MVVLDYRELICGDKVVVEWVVEIYDKHPLATLCTILLYCDWHTLGHESMERLVVREQIGRSNPLNHLYRLLLLLVGNVGVYPLHRLSKPPHKQHLSKRPSQGLLTIRRNIRRIDIFVTELLEQLDCESLYLGFG